MVEYDCAFDAVIDLQGITDVFQLLTREQIELGTRNLAQEVHLLGKDSSTLIVYHLVNVIFVDCHDKGVRQRNHVVHPRPRLL